MQCKLCLFHGIPYDVQILYKTKNRLTGNALAGDCARNVYKNVKCTYKIVKIVEIIFLCF